MVRTLVMFLALTCIVCADGGKIQFQRKAGAFNVTLFSTPSPVRVGRADFSVMVQNAADQSSILDADVRIHLVRHDSRSISEVSAPARHEQATNKLLYAAQMDLNTAAKYRVEISVQNSRDSALVTGDIDVLPPEPPLLAHWPYFAALPLVALLFAINQRLKRRRLAANRQ
jgi:hypothetical protein